MATEMSSKERLLATMDFAQTDRVPIVLRNVVPLQHNWSDLVGRAEYLLGLGIDDIFRFGPPWPYHPEVTVESWCEQATPYPIDN